MTAVAVLPHDESNPAVELTTTALVVHQLELHGTIFELARELGLESGALVRLLRDAVETGAIVIRHGRDRAAIDTVAAEINRLLDGTTAAAERLPAALEEQLEPQLSRLGQLLAGYFDPAQADSVQQQLKALATSASAEQVRTTLTALLGEQGPLAAMNGRVLDKLELVTRSNTDVVERVTRLAERVEARLALDDAQERSSHKGIPFQDVVGAELEAIHGPLGDEVVDTSREYGALPNSQAGDFVIRINPRETRGHDLRIAVEAKTGKLSRPKTQEALHEAADNREAAATVIVFDSVDDAPLGGRSFCPYPQGRFAVVLDASERNPLALEVAMRHARSLALASLESESGIDACWLDERCRELTELIESAREVKNGANAARRGLDKVDSAYDEMREKALVILDEIRTRLSE